MQEGSPLFPIRPARIRGAPWATAMATGLVLAAQAPLPQPKPIVVAPLPRPGQPKPRPAPDASPARPAAPASEAKDGSVASKPTTRAAEYGSTPVPWPRGSTDPDRFPAVIPRIRGAWREAYSLGPQTASAYFLCGQPPAAVARLYLEFAAREQWQLVPIPGPPLGEGRIVIARKGDWSLRVDAAPHPFSGGTEVFVSATLKPLPPGKVRP